MADFNQKATVSISCPKALSEHLTAEVQAMGYRALRVRPTGLDIHASLNDCVKLNLQLRTAHRVHYLLSEKPVETPDELYEWLSLIEWENYIPADGFFSVTSRINHPSINNTQFANLKCKDAIVDRMRSKTGKRPDTGADLNKTVVFLFWNNQSARIFLDTSGESLSRRGYRVQNTEAPMQESLAAGLLMQSSWNPRQHLINPMCGSGTIAIEAALMAFHREAAVRRRNFGFMHIMGFDREVYKQARLEFRERWKKSIPIKIIATDHDPKAVEAATKNAEMAGVSEFIDFQVCDFEETIIPNGDGVILMNPPYGQRIGELKELEQLYQRIGTFLKHECAGKKAYIFTGNETLSKKVGLKSSSKTIFYNTTIECKLLEYELYEGKSK